MKRLRRDVAEAEARMRVTFGTRSAIRNLHESLQDGETVVAMVACLYSGADGLLVLTNRRVLAVRDDFSKFRLQAVGLVDVRALDYAPSIHDGLAVLTTKGRVAVRKMDRTDSDAFASALLTAVPSIIVGASRPQTREPFRPVDASEATAEIDAGERDPDAVAADHRQGGAAVQAAAAASSAVEPEVEAQADSVGVPAVVGAPAQGPSAEATAAPASTVPAFSAAPAEPAAPVSATSHPDTDKEVLLGVLADLHAKGLLTTEELTAKIAQVAGDG